MIVVARMVVVVVVGASGMLKACVGQRRRRAGHQRQCAHSAVSYRCRLGLDPIFLFCWLTGACSAQSHAPLLGIMGEQSVPLLSGHLGPTSASSKLTLRAELRRRGAMFGARFGGGRQPFRPKLHRRAELAVCFDNIWTKVDGNHHPRYRPHCSCLGLSGLSYAV